MGFLDKFKGVKEAKEGVAPVPPDELQRRLLALNSDQIPFAVSPGSGGEGGDVLAEWKIVDANWVEIFGKAGIEKSHRIYLTFDPSENEVRVLEESWDVEWRAGVPQMSVSAEAFRGRTLGSKSFGTGYAFKGVNPLDYGQVYNYKFDVSEMKDPLAEVVTSSGWTFKPVMTKGKLSD
jgi:hypothetical protein